MKCSLFPLKSNSEIRNLNSQNPISEWLSCEILSEAVQDSMHWVCVIFISVMALLTGPQSTLAMDRNFSAWANGGGFHSNRPGGGGLVDSGPEEWSEWVVRRMKRMD